MKIYTKKGDKGETSLFGGQRVQKNSKRIESYGTVDELNSIIGIAIAFGLSEYGSELADEIQQQLFVLGADLATPPSKKVKIDRISPDHIAFLETAIDKMDDSLPELKNFILPGGSRPGAVLHQARTVCRRAERATVECMQEKEVSEHTVVYLNRLSDLLFVWARFENKENNITETPWKA